MKKTAEVNEKPTPPEPGLILMEDKAGRRELIAMAKARARARAAGVPENKLPPEPPGLCVFGHWWVKP